MTDEVRQEIGLRLRSGCTLEVAAQAVGVARGTLQAWLAVGREAQSIDEAGGKLSAKQRECLALLREEQEARATLRVNLLASIQKSAMNGNHHAATWLLERLFPDDYQSKSAGRKERPNAGRPAGATSAPDRRPGVLRAVK